MDKQIDGRVLARSRLRRMGFGEPRQLAGAEEKVPNAEKFLLPSGTHLTYIRSYYE